VLNKLLMYKYLYKLCYIPTQFIQLIILFFNFQSKNVYPEVVEVGQSSSAPFNLDVERILVKVIVYYFIKCVIIIYFYNCFY